MTQKKEEQHEFFEEFKKPKRGMEKLRERYIPTKRLFVTVSIENLVLFSIMIILAAVLSFSLGVERGRRIIGKHVVIPAIEVSATNSEPDAPLTNEESKGAVFEEPALTTIAQEAEVFSSGGAILKYTIQTIAFRKEEVARREKEALEGEGFSVFIIPGNNFFQVCVGRYSTTEKAKADLPRLKEKYDDCFVRDIE